MDRYVYRLETSYKSELQAFKISVQNTQDKVNTLVTRLFVMEQKLAQAEVRMQKQDQCLKYAITIIDDLESRNRQNNTNNIGFRGLTEATGPEELMPMLQVI